MYSVMGRCRALCSDDAEPKKNGACLLCRQRGVQS